MSRLFANNELFLGDTLNRIRDEELPADVESFHRQCLPEINYRKLLKAARVGKHPNTYEDISRGRWEGSMEGLEELDGVDKKALVAEHDSALPERGMLIVILTVSLAAFLQGHVQTSINGATLYRDIIGLPETNQSAVSPQTILHPSEPTENDFYLGITNAAPFFAAAIFGCWMALPISDRFGRKGSMVVAALIVFVTSILLAIVPVLRVTTSWPILLGIRVINGIGMGIKAVNTPILASETAIGFWRGTSILAWQLWVAFGIFVGFVLNFVFSKASDETFSLALILGAPVVPSTFLLCALLVCPESPRYYMKRGPKFNPQKAYSILVALRRSELIAMRDVYLLHKSIQRETEQEHFNNESLSIERYTSYMKTTNYVGGRIYTRQLRDLFRETRLQNPLISTSIVALAQQLCGVNIMAFYSGSFFRVFDKNNDISTAMYFSIGFGAINFIFGLPAIRRIDTIGRRKSLLMTIPPMTLMMLAASLSFLVLYNNSLSDEGKMQITCALVALFLYLHAVFYSPGLGPIPFTLASESFPLSHREVGCAFAISVNLLFAAFLSLMYPSINSALTSPGFLGLFTGFNIIAFVLVFLFVEETGQISLEDLDFIYNVPKRDFWRYQVFMYLPWLFKTYIPYLLRRRRGASAFGDKESQGDGEHSPEPPSLYKPPLEADDPLDSESEYDDTHELHEIDPSHEGSFQIRPAG